MAATHNRQPSSNLPQDFGAPNYTINNLGGVHLLHPINDFTVFTRSGSAFAIHYAEGEVRDYLSYNPSINVELPRMRYAIRITRYSSANALNFDDFPPPPRNVTGNFHLDPLTWRISVSSTDQPFGRITGNTVYHLEIRYQPSFNTLKNQYPLSIAF